MGRSQSYREYVSYYRRVSYGYKGDDGSSRRRRDYWDTDLEDTWVVPRYFRTYEPSVQRLDPPRARNHGAKEDTRGFRIRVVAQTDGRARPNSGETYTISITVGATVCDVISLLAPDGKKKVLVCWWDGETEKLDGSVPLDKLAGKAKHLVVKAGEK